MANVYEPAVNAIPYNLRGKLQPAQLFHEILEHRWYIAEQAGHDIALHDAVQSYIHNILPLHREEATMLEREAPHEPVDYYS